MMLILTFQSRGKLGSASCHDHDNEEGGDDDDDEEFNDDDDDEEEEVDNDVKPRIPIMGEIGPCFLL